MSNLSCGIVGLPNVGKSTLFTAITKKQVAAENYPFCTIDPNVGCVEVYDPRLEKLTHLSKSKKTVYATVSFVDIAGLVKGAAKGEGLGNQFLTHIRETDAILHVVRCFESEKIIHVSGKTDPLQDIETINLELILADLQQAENIKNKTEKKAKGNKKHDAEIVFINKIINHLNQSLPVRILQINEEEKEFMKQWAFLTNKKVIYVANILENDLAEIESNEYIKQVNEFAKEENAAVIPICAKFEEEIAQLDKEEAEEFLKSAGQTESGLNRLVKSAFHLLDLITFLTTGELETKAWTIHRGDTAVQAAGKIHTDIEKGFIRAEVVSYNDMIEYKGRVGARDAGKARSEGKNYIVQDGDVILFFHN